MNGFSIIIPVYNEELILASAAESLIVSLARLKARDFEILFCENGSTDGTMKILSALTKKHYQVRCFSYPSPNFGKALLMGVSRARYETVFLFNADWIDLHFLQEAYTLRHTSDIVVCSKTLNPSLDRRPFYRRLGTRALVFLLRMLFGFQGTDTHGLKLLSRSSVLFLLRLCITEEIIETELLLRARHQGLIIREIPCAISEIRPARVSFFRRGFRVLRELIRLKLSLHYG